ncbi:uncharacterized protein LOC129608139 [Condylostylus longicornis]|uniref:uncharacterized protein LOC129608139 n=1 Tax=Condylostylus longicornis TaxID=2530218 RepID=UPI00244E41F1|nr:uncharacterized protein LOC129608139 [Condylostylus longicornis]
MELIRATSDFTLKKILKHKPKRLLFIILIVAFIASYTIYWDSIIWTISAVGRIAMIKLLPFWDWTYLYNAKCLISKTTTMRDYQGNANQLKECHLCEKLDYIKIVENITFLQLRDNFIYKAQPVLIKNSTKMSSIPELLIKLFDSRDFLQSNPCDVGTNLMQYKFFNLEEVLSYIDEDMESSWFLQLRNCQFSAVKASRQFLKKPYYYAEHMEPFYSSWILMANNYAGLEKNIKLYGLVILQQLQGDLLIVLSPDPECLHKCKEQKIIIKSGESLVFSTDLWNMMYLIDLDQMVLSSIMEVYF